MILEQIGEVKLPAHDKPGGFDHAAVHGPRGRLYVAHTANDALGVIDCVKNTYLGAIPRLEGVAGGRGFVGGAPRVGRHRGAGNAGVVSASASETRGSVW